jgi:hypothetical protein
MRKKLTISYKKEAFPFYSIYLSLLRRIEKSCGYFRPSLILIKGISKETKQKTLRLCESFRDRGLK